MARRTLCTNKSTSKPGTLQSPDGHTFNQIDNCLIDGRHFSHVIDFIARKGANIDSDHMLVVIKLRASICRASNTKLQQLRRFAVDRLKDWDVASRYYDELESELQDVQAQPWMKNVKTKKNNPESTDKHKRKQANKEWFEERHQRASHPKQHQRTQKCLQTSQDEREAFVQKKVEAA
jgi:hypothetical protein